MQGLQTVRRNHRPWDMTPPWARSPIIIKIYKVEKQLFLFIPVPTQIGTYDAIVGHCAVHSVHWGIPWWGSYRI